MPHEEFATDTKTVYAVIRTTEIMGEAAKNIPEEMRREQ
ncbi:MAG: HepT-like ribonuclease domain-containing protein [Thermoplasmata archaeon]